MVVRKVKHIYLHLKATLLREKIMSESKGRLLERALTELQQKRLQQQKRTHLVCLKVFSRRELTRQPNPTKVHLLFCQHFAAIFFITGARAFCQLVAFSQTSNRVQCLSPLQARFSFCPLGVFLLRCIFVIVVPIVVKVGHHQIFE